jgi:hypothetical protein
MEPATERAFLRLESELTQGKLGSHQLTTPSDLSTLNFQYGKKLDAARRELEVAERALAKMEQTSVISEITKYWEDIHGSLIRLSSKPTASLKGDPRFTNSPRVKRVNQALKSDPIATEPRAS